MREDTCKLLCPATAPGCDTTHITWRQRRGAWASGAGKAPPADAQAWGAGPLPLLEERSRTTPHIQLEDSTAQRPSDLPETQTRTGVGDGSAAPHRRGSLLHPVLTYNLATAGEGR